MNWGFAPDILVLLTTLAVVVVDLVMPRQRRGPWILRTAALGLMAAGIALVLVGGSDAQWLGWQLRPWATPLRLAAVVAVLIVLAMLPSQVDRENHRQRRLASSGTVVFLLLASLCGTFALASSANLITFVIALELATIPLYGLVALNRDRVGSEAGIKYLLSGAMATGVLLFGISYLYGAGGSLHFDVLAETLRGPLATAGAALVVLALLFKLAAAPMHVWAPEVYEGASNPVAAYLATGSKVTGLIALLLILGGPLSGLLPDLLPLIMLAAVASLVFGNLGALRQGRLRRFLAWSSIAQIGFFLLALTHLNADGTGVAASALTAIGFYALIYVCSNGLLFLVIDILSESRPCHHHSLRGLSRQSPALALAFTIAVFSLAGLPPLAGFLGKFALLLEPAYSGWHVLVLLGAVGAVVSLYYYLRLIREAYLVEPEDCPPPLMIDAPERWAMSACALAVVILGLWSVAHDWIANLTLP